MPSTMTTTSLLLAALSTSILAQSALQSCPGVLNIQDSNTACCVGGTIPPLTLSSCAGWPICTGPVTVTTTSEPISCATIIPGTASNYDALISSASSSLAASGTNYQTTVAGGASARSSAESLASSLQSSASALRSSLQGSGSAAVSSAQSMANSRASSAGAAATSASGSGDSSAASDMTLQAGLVAGGLLVGAGAFWL